MTSSAKRWCWVATVVLGLLEAGLAPWAWAGAAPNAIVLGQGQTDLLNVAAEGAEKCAKPTSPQVSVRRSNDPAAPGLTVTVQPGTEDYPGVNIFPEGAGAWDISAFGHIEARLINTGTMPVTVSVEPWNDGDWRENPFNCESISLQPGAAGTVSVIFGYSYGYKPGYPLKTAAVARVMLFAGKSSEVQSFRIESLVAGGPPGEKPPVDPASVRTRPKDGVLLGSGVAIDPARQLEAMGGAQASVLTAGLHVSLAPAEGEQWVQLKPAIGRWDLREACELRVKLRNNGRTPLTPRVQVASDSGATDVVGAPAPVLPGASQEIVVPFAAAVMWQGIPNSGDRTSWEGQPGTGTKFNNEAVAAVKLSAEHHGAASLLVESIVADAPATRLPEWLGKRPPVAGEWTQTLDEDFEGSTLNDKLWTPRLCWDGPVGVHVYSERNVLVEGGYLKIKSEKKRGHEYDDPQLGERDYTSGAVTSLGKFTQKYGYFEARMKSPKALGLWPCFWLMPDRGAAAGTVWERRDTGNGGMEIDIWEHLTLFGPYHYNIACHWDGYQAAHKQTGFWLNYNQLDAEGFVVAGLLWEPGKLTWFCNGRAVASWECDRITSVPEYIKFTTQMGGWAGSQIDDELLPDYFVIDYVRVWSEKGVGSPLGQGTPHGTPPPSQR